MTFGIKSKWDLYSNLSWILVHIHMVQATYLPGQSPRGETGDAFSKGVARFDECHAPCMLNTPFVHCVLPPYLFSPPYFFFVRQQSLHRSSHSFLIYVWCLAIVELASVLDMHSLFTISKTNIQSIKSKVHQFKTNSNVSYYHIQTL